MKLIAVAVLCLVSLNINAISMGEAIDRAGQQRMLSQRMAYLYILKGMEPKKATHGEKLEKTIERFQYNANMLKKNKRALAAKESLDAALVEWDKYRALISKSTSKDIAKQVVIQSSVLLARSHDYVLSLQRLSNLQEAELVNISGRQRMLSQRLALNYLADAWNVANGDAKNQFYEDLSEFQTMLDYLSSSKLNSPEITKNLNKTHGHFRYASRGFDGEMSLTGSRLIFVITGTTDKMLRNMDIITKQYVDLLDTQTIASN